MAFRPARISQRQRQVTRHGAPVLRATPATPLYRAAQGVEAPPLSNSDDVPITPSDVDPNLPSTQPKKTDDDQEEWSDSAATPLHIPEELDPHPEDPTTGAVERDERIPGIEPPEAAPVPENQRKPDSAQPYPPPAAPVPGVDPMPNDSGDTDD